MLTDRPITLTNSLGGRLEQFQSLEPGLVKLYTCGPTVYHFAHIGNFRSFLMSDILRRVLEFNGFEVQQVRNITDVGHLTNDEIASGPDRLEVAASRENSTPWDIARFYTERFEEDTRLLNMKEPYRTPHATEFIDSMIALAERLIATGHAYVSDGNVYYAVDTFPHYGKLSGNSVDQLIAGARVEVGEGKRSPADFALWKSAAPDKPMRWPSPWGLGVPGWHLECSAMAMELLGEQIDIHTGGKDNLFPHHEDEIAQSEAATGQPFARYWLHSELLRTPNDDKMAKSAGNIYTVQDVVGRGIPPLAYRYFSFQAHYRTPLTFSWVALEAACTALVRLWEAAAELWQTSEPQDPESDANLFLSRFHESINRDLDMPAAIVVLHDLMGSTVPAGQKLHLLQTFDSVLGLDILAMSARLSETTDSERGLLAEREAARSAREWTRSDQLRDALSRGGLEVKDTAAGQRWTRKDLVP